MKQTSTPTQTRTEMRQQLRVVVHALLPREREDVFDYLTRLENNPEWNWAVTSVSALTDGPPRQGSIYLQGSASGTATTLELTQIEQPHLLEVTSTGNDSTATYRYHLSPATSETTLVSLEVTVQPSHPVGLAKLYLQRLRVSLRSNLDHLREALADRENR